MNARQRRKVDKIIWMMGTWNGHHYWGRGRSRVVSRLSLQYRRNLAASAYWRRQIQGRDMLKKALERGRNRATAEARSVEGEGT